jgi:hypothetical protein
VVAFMAVFFKEKIQMVELKEAYKGQLGDVGKGVATIHFVVGMSTKIIVTDPVQTCVRIEEEELERVEAYCKEKGIRPTTLMGMLLQSAIKEYLDYDKSLLDAEKKREELAEEQAIKDHEEDLKNKALRKAKGKKLQEVPFDLKE